MSRSTGVEGSIRKFLPELGEDDQADGERVLDRVHPVARTEIDRVLAHFDAAKIERGSAFHVLRDLSLHRGHFERYAARERRMPASA